MGHSTGLHRRAYDYGAPEAAARRLRTSAQAFRASSQRFLYTVSDRPFRVALDLGCGPGYSTELLVRILRPEQTIGLDTSEAFLRLARSRAPSGTSFLSHDVTKAPFPAPPADLIYARFMLGYLDDPETILPRWGSQLRTGGLILLEEVQHISTANRVISLYYEILASMLAHQGHGYIELDHVGDELRVIGFGGSIQRLADESGLRRRMSRLARVSRTAGTVSRDFAVHLREVLARDSFVRSTWGEEALAHLESDFGDLAASPTKGREVHWQIRQIILERD